MYNKKNSDDFVCCISLKRFVVMSISLWTTTTMLLFALLLGMSVTAHFVIKRKVEVGLVMKDCAGTIKQIDELLTMSALVSTYNGSVYWIERYNAAIPILDDSIATSLKLMPEDLANKFRTLTKEANDALVSTYHWLGSFS